LNRAETVFHSHLVRSLPAMNHFNKSAYRWA